MAQAKARISASFRGAGMRGSAKITDLPPPCASPAAAFLSVMARASRKHSSRLTSGAMRTPPIEGPHATLSMTTIALRPAPGT